jgi:cell division protein FtsW
LIGIVVLYLYFLLFFWAMQVSLRLKDGFSSLLAAMIGFHIFLQAIMHIAVTIGFLPPTGIPLPFVSIGGTALVVYLVEAGVLIRLAKKAEFCV